MHRLARHHRAAFTLIELLVVVGIIALLISVLVPALSQTRAAGKRAACLSNQRQLGLATRMYLDDHRGELFHHHEGWVLDDGTQLDALPADIQAAEGGGMGNSIAEKPWIIFFFPYLQNRAAGFCPQDATKRSQTLATNLQEYNGSIEQVDEMPPPQSELALAEAGRLTMVSYLLNSVFTHRAARYALEGVLDGFATDTRSVRINPTLVMFSERNSEALNAAENEPFGSVIQDDYDTWVGEAAMVRWGEGPYADQGWIRYNRHADRANYLFIDGHAEALKWRQVRENQFPDRRVRRPLDNPPP